MSLADRAGGSAPVVEDAIRYAISEGRLRGPAGGNEFEENPTECRPGANRVQGAVSVAAVDKSHNRYSNTVLHQARGAGRLVRFDSSGILQQTLDSTWSRRFPARRAAVAPGFDAVAFSSSPDVRRRMWLAAMLMQQGFTSPAAVESAPQFRHRSRPRRSFGFGGSTRAAAARARAVAMRALCAALIRLPSPRRRSPQGVTIQASRDRGRAPRRTRANDGHELCTLPGRRRRRHPTEPVRGRDRVTIQEDRARLCSRERHCTQCLHGCRSMPPGRFRVGVGTHRATRGGAGSCGYKTCRTADDVNARHGFLCARWRRGADFKWLAISADVHYTTSPESSEAAEVAAGRRGRSGGTAARSHRRPLTSRTPSKRMRWA